MENDGKGLTADSKIVCQDMNVDTYHMSFLGDYDEDGHPDIFVHNRYRGKWFVVVVRE